MKKNIFKQIILIPAVILTALSLCGCVRDEVIGFDAGNITGDIPDSEIPEEDNIENDDSPVNGGPVETGSIFVFVCGAVVNPGLVELPEGSRIADALEKAGGFTENADVNYVNLASVLSDGQKVYFPEIGEAVAVEPGQESSDPAGDKVNINTAGKDALCSLPGIGDSKAEAIIAYREEKGVFSKPEDIMNVSGIGELLYEKIKNRICV